HRHIGVTGNEDDRKRDLATTELADEFYAVCPGHADIGYYAPRRQSIYRLKKGVSRVVGLDGESEHAEHLAKRVADRLLIVYDKDGRARHRHVTCDGASGSENRNSVAPASREWSQRRPPCDSTIDRQIGRPRPSPASFDVASGSNSRSANSRSTPGPLSDTPISTCGGASNRYAAMPMRPSALRAPAIDSIAFRMRLRTTCSNCVRSP